MPEYKNWKYWVHLVFDYVVLLIVFSSVMQFYGIEIAFVAGFFALAAADIFQHDVIKWVD